MPDRLKRPSFLSAIVASLLVLFSAGCATQEAQPSTGEVLLFSEIGNQNLQDSVSLIGPDGANLKLLLPRQNNRSFLYAHGNSVRTRLVVIAHELKANNSFQDHLFLYVPGTGELNQLVNQDGNGGNARLAPDDVRVAYEFSPAAQPTESQIWVSDLSGQARALTGAPNQIDRFPVWRTDGSEIWFLRLQFSSGRVDSSLMKMPPTGGNPSVIFGPAERVGAVAFSPDNSRFAMWTARGLETVEASTLARTVILPTSALPNLVLQAGSLAWSHKQPLLALALFNTQSKASEIWTVATDGSNPRPIYHVSDGFLYLGAFVDQ